MLYTIPQGLACGHDASGHYSTARDLARLSHVLLEQPQLLAFTSQPQGIIVSEAGKSYALTNKNALIGRYPGALGLKTGYTAQAGKCLVAYAERDGHRVLLACISLTVLRNQLYADEVSLWQNTATKSPHKARVHNNHGYAYLLAQRHDEARHAFIAALRLNPQLSAAHYNLMRTEKAGGILRP